MTHQLPNSVKEANTSHSESRLESLFWLLLKEGSVGTTVAMSTPETSRDVREDFMVLRTSPCSGSGSLCACDWGKPEDVWVVCSTSTFVLIKWRFHVVHSDKFFLTLGWDSVVPLLPSSFPTAVQKDFSAVSSVLWQLTFSLPPPPRSTGYKSRKFYTFHVISKLWFLKITWRAWITLLSSLLTYALFCFTGSSVGAIILYWEEARFHD